MTTGGKLRFKTNNCLSNSTDWNITIWRQSDPIICSPDRRSIISGSRSLYFPTQRTARPPRGTTTRRSPSPRRGTTPRAPWMWWRKSTYLRAPIIRSHFNKFTPRNLNAFISFSSILSTPRKESLFLLLINLNNLIYIFFNSSSLIRLSRMIP